MRQTGTPLDNLTQGERNAYMWDVWRAWPRLLLLTYVGMACYVAFWFMNLKDASGAQAAFVSTTWGVFPLVLNFYSSNGIDWERRISERVDQCNTGGTNG